jgi:hypothetical protein
MVGPDNIPDDDWEEWDGRGSFVHHMLAGSAAGLAEHLVMYPVDTFKVSLLMAGAGVTSWCGLG